MRGVPVISAPIDPASDEAIAAALADDRALLLVDGQCMLCSRGAGFVMRVDRNRRLRIGTGQSAIGRALYERYGEDEDETILLVAGERAFTKSAGVIEALRRIGRGWRWLGWLAALAPERWRDAGYDWLARNRFRLFGRRTSCLMPTQEQRDRFVT